MSIVCSSAWYGKQKWFVLMSKVDRAMIGLKGSGAVQACHPRSAFSPSSVAIMALQIDNKVALVETSRPRPNQLTQHDY